jgi:membrane glycosyltransferase
MTGIVWIGTGVIVFFSIMFIVLVVWFSSVLTSFKTFYKKRDEHFVKRISELEALLKTEFAEVIKSLKKL